MKILFLDKNHALLINGLRKLGHHCQEAYSDSKTSIEQNIANYDGLVIRSRFAIDQQFIDKATSLKFIARVGAGLENIDTEYAKQCNIELISAPEGNSNAVGEHALGMLLSLFNNLTKADREVRQGKWLREENRGLEVDGKTIGLIGYGNMGKAFAKKLSGFDVRVLCYDIQEGVGNQHAKQVSLAQLQAEADVLSLHTPQTPQTINMVNAEFIAKFSKPFWLINTARGKSVHTEDLVAALKQGKILGAGLDVLSYEKSSFEQLFIDEKIPPAFSYLINSDRVLLSPHVAGWTVESNEKLAQTIVDKVATLFGQA